MVALNDARNSGNSGWEPGVYSSRRAVETRSFQVHWRIHWVKILKGDTKKDWQFNKELALILEIKSSTAVIFYPCQET